MKKLILTLSFLSISFVLVFNTKAQQNDPRKTRSVINSEKELKSNNSKITSSPMQRMDKIEKKKTAIQKKYKSDHKYLENARFNLAFEIDALPDDSAYLYAWNDLSKEWERNIRLYYYSTNSGIEIIEDKYVDEGTNWMRYRRTLRDYDQFGYLAKETEQYWQESTKEWLTGYYDEYNDFGYNVEFYSKTWNDTIRSFTEGIRIVSTYTNDTSLVEELIQVWLPESKTWANDFMVMNNYNSNGWRISSLEKFWDDEIEDWRNSYSVVFDYDGFGEMVNQKSQYWDTVAGKWVNDIQIKREYDDIGSLTTELYQSWDTLASNWLNVSNSLYTYNDFFQPLTNLYQVWDKKSSSWNDTIKATFNYDNDGNILEYLEEQSNKGIWKNNYREVYTYNNLADVTEIKVELWDHGTETWQSSIIYSYEYDSQRYILSEKTEFWNENLKIWETGFLDQFDAAGNRIEYFDKEWNDSLNVFTDGFRLQNEYFNNGWIKSQVSQVWDTINISWLNEEKIVFYWYGVSSLDIYEYNTEIKIFPIPFKDAITIETDENTPVTFIEIFDGQGRLVDSRKVEESFYTQLDLSHLQKGTYFLMIESGETRSMKRIIKN